MIVAEQMDIALMNAIHYGLSLNIDTGVVKNTRNPILDYAEYLLLRMTQANFEETKKSFFRLPLQHLQEPLSQLLLETLLQMSVEQV